MMPIARAISSPNKIFMNAGYVSLKIKRRSNKHLAGTEHVHNAGTNGSKQR